jgi:hypothetical protein
VRFSAIVNERFLFLRGDRLEIYNESDFEAVDGIDSVQVPEVLRKYFGFDVQSLFSPPPEPHCM